MRDYFWLPPAPEFTHSPLTDEQIEEAQERLAVSLPQTYIEILKVQNGGYLRYDTHPTSVATQWAEDHVMVDHIMGIGPHNSILDTPTMIAQHRLPTGVLPLCWHGHYWVCLDYRDCGPLSEPSVVWIDNKSKQEVILATDFAQFLAGLVHGYHCHVFGFVGASDAVTIAQKLTQGLGYPFKKSVTGTSYFLYHQDWRAFDEHSRATLLITANRNDTGDYRYPFHTQCDWLLICNISRSRRDTVEAIMSQYLTYPVELIHEPPWGRQE
ncbi:MAG: SMI1/KNR4 family protein [Acidobacteriota bacterium]